MKHNNKRILKYLIYSNILILGIIAAGVFLFKDKKIIESLLVPHRIVNIFIIYIHVFLPVSAGSVFFVFNLTEAKKFKPGTVNYFLSSLNYIILPLFAVYSFLLLYLNPLLIEKRIWIENLSETAGYYQNEIFRNRETDIEKAYVFSNLYLYIDPESEKINKIHDDIYIELLGKRENINKSAEEENSSFTPMLLTGEKLIEISGDFLEKNDYSSAIYYSEMAAKFRNYRQSSKEIVSKAEKVLKQYVNIDPDINILYRGKLEIEDLYNKNQYIESYYRTIEIQEKFSSDTELISHKTRLLEKLKDISFFYEDIEEFIFVPGKENIVFRDIIDNETALIYCGKIVFADNNVYLFNINSYYPESGKSWHAPFGKIINSSLNMNCISREKRKFFQPQSADIKEKLISIPVSYTGEDIINFTGENGNIRKISLLDLVTKTEILKKGKYSGTALIIEGAERIIKCINYMMILFISVYSGLSFMKRRKRKNYMSLMLFPVVLISAAAADYLLFNLNAEIFKNLITDSGRVMTFILFPLLIIFEFITSLYLTIKRSDADPD